LPPGLHPQRRRESRHRHAHSPGRRRHPHAGQGESTARRPVAGWALGPVPQRAGPTSAGQHHQLSSPRTSGPVAAARTPIPRRCGSACGAAQFAYLVCDCGRRSAARKAAAGAGASGLRLANFPPTALPRGSLGKLRARTLHSTALIPAHISITEKANKGRRRHCLKGIRHGQQNPPTVAQNCGGDQKRWPHVHRCAVSEFSPNDGRFRGGPAAETMRKNIGIPVAVGRIACACRPPTTDLGPV
jgi:hypothetical protein